MRLGKALATGIAEEEPRGSAAADEETPELVLDAEEREAAAAREVAVGR
ncbi:hypothetical protein [Streptomyces sp. AN091965]|nr:hypothetical protein [Streptomyces sp. AN091965]MCI3929843.1 hypothetical protein [Streptomyces sp. AN091965]